MGTWERKKRGREQGAELLFSLRTCVDTFLDDTIEACVARRTHTLAKRNFKSLFEVSTCVWTNL